MQRGPRGHHTGSPHVHPRRGPPSSPTDGPWRRSYAPHTLPIGARSRWPRALALHSSTQSCTRAPTPGPTTRSTSRGGSSETPPRRRGVARHGGRHRGGVRRRLAHRREQGRRALRGDPRRVPHRRRSRPDCRFELRRDWPARWRFLEAVTSILMPVTRRHAIAPWPRDDPAADRARGRRPHQRSSDPICARARRLAAGRRARAFASAERAKRPDRREPAFPPDASFDITSLADGGGASS